MKKFFVFIMFLSITTVSFAQFTIGIKSGYNTSLGFDMNWNFDSQRGSISKDLSNGFNIGLMTRFGGRVYA